MEMNEKLSKYLDNEFSPYVETNSVKELKEELMNNLQEKLNDLREQGHDDETAFSMTIKSIGDISEMLDSNAEKQTMLQQQEKEMDFTKMDLREADLGVSLKKAEFSKSDLRDADFTEANLSYSSFIVCDLRNVIFDGANLTGAKLSKSDLSKTSFKHAKLNNTDLSYSDLSGVPFENQIFNGTNFYSSGLKGTNFKNAVFKNASFKYAYACNKANFDGATMDKVTYAVLKKNKADLTNVTVI
ncbi:hypothetical protein GCM10008934_03940 [Virgibacillus salarius]